MVPDKELAKRIASSHDTHAVKELIENLTNKNKNIQSDCIKTIDEVAKLKPQLISAYAENLMSLLNNQNNRLQWGAMAVLNSITDDCKPVIYSALPQIIASADYGSVITNDHCVNILVKLAAIPEYTEDTLTLLMERILKSPPNQLPTYAENALSVIDKEHKQVLIEILSSRLGDIETETKLKRIEKVLKKLQRL